MYNNKEKEFENSIIMGKVICQITIAKDIYKMTIGGEETLKMCQKAKAGQFINIYLKDKSTLLPRPISICNIEKDSIDIVYKVVGKGTEELLKYIAGDEIKISSGLGNGYIIEDRAKKNSDINDKKIKECVLVGGGVGIPPLIQLAKELKKRQAKITMILGFQEEPFLVTEAEKYCEHVYVATENGTTGYHGNVIQLIKEKNIIGHEFFSCGPKTMLKALARHCEEIGAPVQVSLEERMGCGYGACVGCTCKTTKAGGIVQKAVCKDGPIFYGSEVVWDE